MSVGTQMLVEPSYHSLVGHPLGEHSVQSPRLSQNWAKHQGTSDTKSPHPSLKETAVHKISSNDPSTNTATVRGCGPYLQHSCGGAAL